MGDSLDISLVVDLRHRTLFDRGCEMKKGVYAGSISLLSHFVTHTTPRFGNLSFNIKKTCKVGIELQGTRRKRVDRINEDAN